MIQKTKRSIQWVIEKNLFPKNQKYAGTHLIADFWDGKKIEEEKRIKDVLIKATKEAGCTPLKTLTYKFIPHGLTGVVLLAESHISIHTWPEFNYIAIDIFTCGDKALPQAALDYFKKELSPKKVETKKIKRGKISN